MKILRATGVILAAGALVFALAGASGAGLVLAATSHISPSKVEADTTTLYWNGSQGLPLNSLCGADANPGSNGFQNGATADNYLLWLFNPGGTITGSATLWIDGSSFGSVDGHQFVTPGFDPTTIVDAHMSFTVDDPGNANWVLTLSHGCVGQQSSSSSSSSTAFSSSQSGQSSSSASTTTSSSSSSSTTSSSTTSSSSTSFSSNQSGESSSSASHTLPQTSAFGDTSGPKDSSWMLVAALGMLLGSVLVLAPARVKNRR